MSDYELLTVVLMILGIIESFSQNTQRLGRELMTPAELATMPGDRCILQLRGLPPFYSPKYDLKQHPNYKYTAEADKKKNAFDLPAHSTAYGKAEPQRGI